MCAGSLDILNRTVMVPMHPKHSDAEIKAIVHNIEVASRAVLADDGAGAKDILPTSALDAQKFDMSSN
jgi:hypothetical protein